MPNHFEQTRLPERHWEVGGEEEAGRLITVAKNQHPYCLQGAVKGPKKLKVQGFWTSETEEIHPKELLYGRRQLLGDILFSFFSHSKYLFDSREALANLIHSVLVKRLHSGTHTVSANLLG